MAPRGPATARLIDITMPFGDPAGTWPGDAPFETGWTARIGARGKFAVNLSRFCSSSHNGTHSDAPFHVLEDGGTSESLRLEAFLGRCVVVDATRVKGSELPETLLDEAIVAGAERVLFKTRRGAPPKRFPKAFKGLSLGLAEAAAAQRLALVGTDAPSMDPFDAKGLPAHKALFGGGVAVLENLDLSQAGPGPYELLALPLKVAGLCAAPVRAVLRPL